MGVEPIIRARCNTEAETYTVHHTQLSFHTSISKTRPRTCSVLALNHTRFPSNFDFLILSLAKVSSDQRLERRKAKQLGAEKQKWALGLGMYNYSCILSSTI